MRFVQKPWLRLFIKLNFFLKTFCCLNESEKYIFDRDQAFEVFGRLHFGDFHEYSSPTEEHLQFFFLITTLRFILVSFDFF